MGCAQTEAAECPHNIVTRWHFLDDGSGNLWACVECRRRFDPVAGSSALAVQLSDALEEIEVLRECCRSVDLSYADEILSQRRKDEKAKAL